MKHWIFVLGLAFAFPVFSQVDSVSVSKVKRFDLPNDFVGEYNFTPVDTSISSFHQYQTDGMTGFVNNGNMGLAISSLFFPKSTYGFAFGEDSFTNHVKGWKEDIVYDTKVPFVRAAYTSGPKKYQGFDVFFTQNLNPRMNVSVKLNTYGGDGFYLNQSTSTRMFSIQNSFRTRSNRYGYFIKFDVQSAKLGENGGMKGDSIYLSSLRGDKLNVQVWYDQDSENHYDKRHFELNQYFRISKESQTDSTAGYFLFLRNEVDIYDYWYENSITDSSYFGQQFELTIADSSMLTDKSKLSGLDNDLGFRYISKTGKFEGVGGVNIGYYTPGNFNMDTTFFSNQLFAKIKRLQLQKFVIRAEGYKGVSGFNRESFRILAALEYPLFANSSSVSLGLVNQKNLPEFKKLWYAGNTISWNNDFDYVSENELRLGFHSNPLRLHLAGTMATISNFTYYGPSALPIQHSPAFNRYELILQKNITLKSYHLDFNLKYQVVDDDAPVNIPEWWWSVSFYYQRYLFDKALELRYGIDYWQNTSYTADNYAPFTRSYTLQNNYVVGDYPYLDFYISARIKSAQGFIKFQNVGQLFLEQPYMMVPYYSMQDFAFSWGIRWDFFN